MRGHVIETSHNDSHPLLWMTEGRSVSAKSDKMTWRSEWMPCLEKFSKNALKASSSWNRTVEGEGSVDEEAPERKGFQARVHLCLGAIDTTNVNRFRGEEEKINQKSLKQFKYIKYKKKRYVCMGNAWTCDMQNKKTSWAQPNPILPAHEHITHI